MSARVQQRVYAPVTHDKFKKVIPSLDFTKVKDYNSEEDQYYEESVKNSPQY